ncbi:FHA domain-containing protein [Chloroflexus aggregans]|uniref:FHA domain containing protein n=1 Tax=Chloroflexus aggregans (strain MD-66 / DSM 9485) TaxID=326427 RepID=B8GAJ4_CHLAD|nr:FHA domain-containing protein [Chloroflexus aggregans]ACL26569.1 FHA domain containing protein [Chloroflexus aggregans DSM 9485]
MIICSHCQSQQLDGTIFCTVCGASLISTTSQRQTTASLNRAAESVQLLDDTATVLPAPEPTVSEPTVALVVLSSGRRITLPVTAEILIGRKDQQRSFFPDVDFSLDGGYDAGVSRRHARIICQNGTYMLEDLGSSNGTFLNRQRVPPGQPMLLKHGDEVQFGMLLVRFELHR